MSDNISLVETELIDEKVQKILRQTNYSVEEAGEKLKEHSYDEISVIKAYFGIKEKPTKQIISINQEIYKQLRNKLDSNMRDYNIRVEKGEVKKII